MNEESFVVFTAVGDIMLGGKIEDLVGNKPDNSIFEEVSSLLEQSDIVFGNLECPLTSHSEKATWDYTKILDKPVIINGKEYGNSIYLKASPKMSNYLKKCKFSILSLANNHIMDYGITGLTDTIKILNKIDIKYIGCGYNIEDARMPVIFDIKGIKLGFLAYCDIYIASKKRAGNCPLKYVYDDIKKLKTKSDIIIVSIHQGMDLADYPLTDEIELMHSIIDAGAKIVLRHHPHVIQGIEEYADGLIFYSLGNLIFDYTVDPLWKDLAKSRESLMVKFLISKTKIESFKIIPIFIDDNFRPKQMSLENEIATTKRINILSSRIINPETSFYEFNQNQDCYAKTQYLLAFHVILASIKKRKFDNIFLIIKRIQIRHLRSLFNLLSESLRRIIY